MQSMMIQDFTAGNETNGYQQPAGPRELPAQPFGKLLGDETARVAEGDGVHHAENAGQAQKAQGSQTKAAKTAGGRKAETEGCVAPFFMASLFDQSATFVRPSENAGLVAAAERVQRQIGAWLQTQQASEASPNVPHVADGGEVTEMLTAALEVLDQVAALEQQADGADHSLPQANSELPEIAELKQLMAIMLQSGQVPDSLKGHPLVADLQKQLDQLPLAEFRGENGTVVKTSLAETVEMSDTLPEHADLALLLAEGTKQPPLKSAQHEQFASLLKPRQDQPSLQDLHAARAESSAGTPAIAQMLQGDVAVRQDLKLESVARAVESGVATDQLAAAVGAAGRQRIDPQQAMAAPRLMQLASGQQLPESQLVDQIVTHLTGSRDGETGRMRLNLHPAELGTLKLDLKIDGDRVRAHLQAQSQQVQEVLDRNLPQLRSALQNMGLKIDEFRIDFQAGQQRDQGQGQSFAWQHQQQGREQRGPWVANDGHPQEIAVPLDQLLRQAAGGISLRV